MCLDNIEYTLLHALVIVHLAFVLDFFVSFFIKAGPDSIRGKKRKWNLKNMKLHFIK